MADEHVLVVGAGQMRAGVSAGGASTAVAVASPLVDVAQDAVRTGARAASGVG